MTPSSAPAAVAAYAPTVTSATPGGRARRLRASWPLMTVLVLVVVLVALAAFSARSPDYTRLSINNSTEFGARALAQVLRSHDVDVRQVRTLSGARITDPATTTVVIVDPAALASYQIASILDYPGPVVFLGGAGSVYAEYSATIAGSRATIATTASAQCPHPDARVAETISGLSTGVELDDHGATTACFPVGDNAYAMLEETIEGRLVTVLTSPDGLTNHELAEAGNAALALRVLGRQPSVVWYVADALDATTLTWAQHGTSNGGGDPITLSGEGPSIFPRGTQDALFMLGLAALVLALVRGRRFGPLVPEPLPVVVAASEATAGRARLYRRNRSYGRATASLRAASAVRISRRLGVARYAPPDSFIDAVARASHHSREQVRDIFYGQPARTEADMHRIVSRLDQLESEVHRT